MQVAGRTVMAPPLDRSFFPGSGDKIRVFPVTARSACRIPSCIRRSASTQDLLPNASVPPVTGVLHVAGAAATAGRRCAGLMKRPNRGPSNHSFRRPGGPTACPQPGDPCPESAGPRPATARCDQPSNTGSPNWELFSCCRGDRGKGGPPPAEFGTTKRANDVEGRRKGNRAGINPARKAPESARGRARVPRWSESRPSGDGQKIDSDAAC